MNVFRIYAGTEMQPWLHKVAAPSLVLTGEFDGGCNPRLNKLIADALPNSELVVLPGYKPLHPARSGRRGGAAHDPIHCEFVTALYWAAALTQTNLQRSITPCCLHCCS